MAMPEYPYIRAWGKMLQSFDSYIEHEVARAKEDEAPQNAIYLDSDKKTWHTADEISDPDTKRRIESIVDHMRYKAMYDEVIASGKYHGKKQTTEALAQLAYAYKYDAVEKKSDAVWAALELFEEMTGFWWDPTQDEFDDMVAGIVG